MISFVSCSEKETYLENSESINNPEILAFIKSNDFSNSVYKNLEINHTLTTLTIVKEDNLEIPLINIVFGKTDNIIGVLQAIKLTESNSSKKVLPNNNDYAMIFTDFSKFNIKNGDGKISVVDVNYDYSVFFTANYIDKKLIDSEMKRIDIEILNKYNYFGNDKNLQMKISDSCSGGSDGNVSWSECRNCLNGICYSDPSCGETLLLTDMLGYFSGYGAIGSASIGAACVVIAAMY